MKRERWSRERERKREGRRKKEERERRGAREGRERKRGRVCGQRGEQEIQTLAIMTAVVNKRPSRKSP